jgi:serine/threonine protein kinase/tetratricopeptide (TPR) repeat protein
MSSGAQPGSRDYSRANFSNSPSGDISSSLGDLTREQRERLTDVLDRYLSSLENDAPLSQQFLLDENPDIASALGNYFRSLEDLHDMAAGFGGGPAPTILEEEPKGQKKIGDFELLREIGRGGMGVVYEARQISLDRRVAVKLLPFAAVLDAKQIARFKHEAQAAAQLHHPNIVPVFAIGVDRGVHYYAMQYIDGQPLDRAIEELRGKRSAVRGRKPESLPVTRSWSPGAVISNRKYSHPGHLLKEEGTVERNAAETRDDRGAKTRQASRLVVGSTASSEHYRSVARLGMQAAEALHAAHEYGVVHRDVKPSNLLVEAGGKLWITDFGLARFGRDGGLTRSGDLIGTIRYMSPEQAAGSAALVDHRTDIYSLGVTLYELATLRPAFSEENEAALLRQIGSYTPPRPRTLRTDIPADLETVILKAMSPEKETRYATAAELAADLQCILEERPTTARPPTLLDRAGRWARRHQRVVAGALMALAVTLAGLSAAVAIIGRATEAERQIAKKEGKTYRQARDILERIVMRYAGKLEGVPGAEQVHQELLRDARQEYRALLADAAGDPARQSAAAVAYSDIGARLDDAGLVAESIDVQTEVADRIIQHLNAEPDNWELQKELAIVHSRLGVSLLKNGQAKVAEERLQDAIRTQERLLARQPKDKTLGAELALSLSNLGLVQHQLHQSSQAAATFEDASSRFDRLLAEAPADSRLAQQSAKVFNNWAAVYAAERPTEAARLHSKAIDTLRQLAGREPANLSVQDDLGRALNNLGAALARTGQAAKARGAIREAAQVQQSLITAAPARASYQVDLAVTWNNLGTLENRQGDHEEAQSAFQASIALYSRLAEQLSGNAGIQSSLASVYNNLAIDQEKGGELEAAANSLALAIQHQEAAAAASPEVSKYQELLAKHIESRLRIVKKLGGGAKSLPGQEKLPNRYESEGRIDYSDRG